MYKNRIVRIAVLLAVSLLVALSMSITVFAATSESSGETPAFHVEDKLALAGETITVKIRVENNPGILNATITLSYDERLTLTNIEKGSALSTLDFTPPGNYSTPCNFLWDALDNADTSNGVVLVLTFTVPTDAEAGTEYSLDLSYVPGDIADGELRPVEFAIKSGKIEVIDYIPGDVNGDGRINGTDITLIRRYIAGGYGVSIIPNAADVNDDGRINGTDVTLIRRYIAGGYGVELKPSDTCFVHDLIKIEAVEATCTEKGNVEYWHCPGCHNYYGDEQGKTEISLKDTVTQPKGHTEVTDEAKAPNCGSTGLTEGKHCSTCGEVFVAQEEIPALGHDFIATVYPPQCLLGGYSVYHCSRCTNFYTDDYVDQLGHTEVIDEAKAPTCDTTGLTEGKHCSVCESIIVSQEIIPALGHDYEAVVTAPTCTDYGYTTYTCHCGYTYSDWTVSLGHDFIHVEAVPETCTEAGITAGRYCTRCDYKEGIEVAPALGHLCNGHTTWPTCTEAGYKTYTCQRCDYTNIEIQDPARGHIWSDGDCTTPKICFACGETEGEAPGHSYNTIVNAPNCYVGGYTAHVCSVCNYGYFTDEVPALGHSYDVIVTAPTCTNDGYTTYKCSRCSHRYTNDEVPALGHTEVISAAVAPTCTATGLTEGKHCDVCGEIIFAQTVVPALGHTEVTDAAVAATCTATGLTEGKHCSVCVEVLVAQEVVAALGHTIFVDVAVAPTCTATGLTEGKHCSVCGEILVAQEVVEALGHSFGDWVTVKEATVDEEGLKERYCDCGEKEAEVIPSKASKGLEYILNSDGSSYYVTGIGTCTDTDIIIPSVYEGLPVTGIYYNAFGGCISLISITIPDGVTFIEERAFYGCSSLTSITIPDGVTRIGYNAFEGCISLTSITIPDSVTFIGTSAFKDCLSLTNITIPDGVTNIGNYTFYNCSGLTSITIPDSVTSISGSAFYGCSNLIQIENGVSYVDKWVVGCDRSVTTAVLREDTVGIGENAFYNCSNLTSISIPDSVTSIGNNAFTGCNSLTSINFEGTVEQWQAITKFDGWDSYTGECTIYCTDGMICKNHTEVVDAAVAPTCTSTGLTEGKHCSVCCEILVAQEVVAALGHSFGDWVITKEATTTEEGLKERFCACGAKETEVIPVKVSEGLKFTLNDDGASYSVTGKGTCLDTDVVIPSSYNDLPVTSIGDSAFKDCDNIQTIKIPNSVTSICYRAFYDCDNLLRVTIPNSVTSIASQAFIYCSSLASITIPDSVTSMGSEIFNSCNALEEIYFGSGLEVIYSGWFSDCPSIKIINVNESNLHYYSEGNCLVERATNRLILGGGECTIPQDVTSIGSYAFSDRETLESIFIPANVTKIESFAFKACKGLVSVVLSEGVNLIEHYAFISCVNLENIEIPSSVTSIGTSAFASCWSLTSITIPDGVTDIGSQAFYSCKSLTSITIPTSVTRIGNLAFGWCTSLASINFDGTVERWNAISRNIELEFETGEYIIYCADGQICKTHTEVVDAAVAPTCTATGLTEGKHCSVCGTVLVAQEVVPALGHDFGDWVITKEATTTEEGLMERSCDCGETEANIIEKLPITLEFTLNDDGESYSVTGIGDWTDPEVVIPDTYKGLPVTAIGNRAFYMSNNITNVVIGDNVTNIGEYAFYYCRALESVIGGNSIKIIGVYAFQGCAKLTNIVGGEYLTSIYSWAFADCTSLTNITIPASVTEIGSSTFRNCTSLESVEILASLKYISEQAFYGCSALENINIPNTVTTIEESAFRACDSLVTISLPNSVTAIYDYAFEHCSSLESIVIPDGVTTIKASAFENCAKLSSITIPTSVKSIYANAFSYCSKLTTIEYEGTIAQWNSITKYSGWNTSTGNYAIYCTDGLICKKHVEVVDEAVAPTCTATGLTAGKHCSVCGEVLVAQEVVSKTSHEYENYVCIVCGYSDWFDFVLESDGTYSVGAKHEESFPAEELVIPSNRLGKPVTRIYSEAFMNCEDITSVIIPDSVKYISSRAFYSCDDLKNVTLGNGVTYIGDYAFGMDQRLNNIIIPNSVTTIGAFAFERCISFTEIIIPENVTSIGESAFESCRKLKNIAIPDNVTNLGTSAFYDCWALESVTIGTGVTNIGEYTFGACSTLMSVAIPDSVTSIGSRAFYNCSSLTSINFEGTVQQCQAITKGNSWDYNTGDYTIYCTNGEIAKDGTITCNHNYTATVTPPTALEDGLATYTCSCGDSYTEAIVPTDFIVNSSNRSKIGYTGKFQENLYIPAVFQDGDQWYRVVDIAESAFWDCSRLSYVSIPDSVRSIGDSAFRACIRLTNVDIGNGVTSIGNSAFISCEQLSGVSCGGNLTFIDYCAFAYCSLTGIRFDGTVEQWNAIEKDSYWNYCTEGYTIYCTDGEIAQDGTVTYYEVASKGLEYTLNSDGTSYSVTGIGTCTDTDIIIPDTYEGLPVTGIGDSAFYGFTKITSIKLTSNITTIGASAFEACISIVDITIPNVVTRIGDKGFFGCTCLERITFQGTIAQWNSIAKGTNLDKFTTNYIIYCTDGQIAKNGTVTYN